MMTRKLHIACLAGASIAALTAASAAYAQAAADNGALEEVVVTATRQQDTVNRVPLSIAAVTQQALDQQGIKSATELTRLVPGLSISTPGASVAVGAFSIRGIVGGVGAATTGVYLDDTSLTKRANNGVQQNNGAPLPVLFDLERVEVLKGPQGTLYDGSSQGGTIRFVTPEPSLTRYSGLLRLEGRTIKMGEEGYEVGAAVGGPIVQDKLGFRISGLRRKTPGWIDGYNPYTGKLVGKDINQNDDVAVRAALKWQPTERLSFTLAAYQSRNIVESQITSPTKVYSNRADGKLAAPGETFTTPETCINTQTRNLATQPILAYNSALGINQAPGATPVVPANCTATTPAAARFIRPAATYGPFDYLGPDDNLMAGQLELTKAQTILRVYNLTTDYDFDKLRVKAITSYVQDKSSHQTPQGTEDPSSRQTLTTVTNGARGFNLFAARPGFAGYFNAFSHAYPVFTHDPRRSHLLNSTLPVTSRQSPGPCGA